MMDKDAFKKYMYEEYKQILQSSQWEEWVMERKPSPKYCHFSFSKNSSSKIQTNFIKYLKHECPGKINIRNFGVAHDYEIEFHNPFTISCSDFKAKIISGKYEYTVGDIVEFKVKEVRNSIFRNNYIVKIVIEVPYNNSTKRIEKVPSQFELVDNNTPRQFYELTKEEKEKIKDAKAPKEFINKFGHSIKVGTLIVIFSHKNKEMVYGQVVKLHQNYFKYKTAKGESKKCYKPNMVYVPQDQKEFESDLALEILKS